MNNKKSTQRRSDHSVLLEISQAVREAYIRERKEWKAQRNEAGGFRLHPRWDAPQKSGDTPWIKLARFLIENEIPEYISYLRAVFTHYAKGALPPTPIQCYGEKAKKIWLAGATPDGAPLAAVIVRRISLALTAQQAAYARQLSMEREMAEDNDEEIAQEDLELLVLFNGTIELSALFRYTLARQKGLHSVMRRYWDAALVQYLLSRSAYQEVWGEQIPEEIREEARQACDLILSAIRK